VRLRGRRPVPCDQVAHPREHTGGKPTCRPRTLTLPDCPEEHVVALAGSSVSAPGRCVRHAPLAVLRPEAPREPPARAQPDGQRPSRAVSRGRVQSPEHAGARRPVGVPASVSECARRRGRSATRARSWRAGVRPPRAGAPRPPGREDRLDLQPTEQGVHVRPLAGSGTARARSPPRGTAEEQEQVAGPTRWFARCPGLRPPAERGAPSRGTRARVGAQVGVEMRGP
jgi:hypothetical protein